MEKIFKIKREINVEFYEDIGLNQFLKTGCISSIVDISLENEILLRTITLQCTKVPFAKAPRARRAGWNLIRALARVNTRIVHSLSG